jgi:uncharacterized membrane protein
MKRVYSIDFTRGLVMIIMALDHVRDLMHVNSVTQSPTELTTTTYIVSHQVDHLFMCPYICFPGRHIGLFVFLK